MNQQAIGIKERLQFAVIRLTWLIGRVALGWPSKGRQTSAGAHSAVLVPCDPFTLVGSRGDAAMLEATHSYLAGSLTVLAHGTVAEARAAEIGVQSKRLVFDWFQPIRMARFLRQERPDQVLVMGADFMDGHYSPVHSLRLLICADLAARAGADARFLGFSLNDRIHPAVAGGFRRLSAKVRIQLRDPLSFDRYKQLNAPSHARLVADSAFLLPPTKAGTDSPTDQGELQSALAWVALQRANGRQVIGVNLHGMLFPKSEREVRLHKLLENFVAAMRDLQGRAEVAWILVPHDDRQEAGDLSTAAALRSMIPADVMQHTYELRTAPPPGDAKALVGHLDGVITARMHLAIATLGMGRPVLVLTYQSKFEGLLRHFGLSDDSKLDAPQTQDRLAVTSAVESFIGRTDRLALQVAERLPSVMVLARATFD